MLSQGVPSFAITQSVHMSVMSHHGGRAFHGSGHGKQKKEDAEKEKVELAEEEEEEEDPFDTRIKNSGCADLHYALLVSFTFLHWSKIVHRVNLSLYK